MTNSIKNTFFTFLALITATVGFAQDAGFIYGTITTEDGRDYTGPIRWDDEEVFWSDMFNVAKEENDYINYLSRDELDDLHDRYYNENNVISAFGIRIFNSWDDNDEDFTHQFSTQFGNISEIIPRGYKGVDVVLQNGDRYTFSGEGYNDVGDDIRILDEELGELAMDWRRIEKIQFKATPSKLPRTFGVPLFGKVKTYRGEYEGYIEWDHDERLTTDVLDGDTRDGDLSIPFSSIEYIESQGNGSEVRTKTGRVLDLRGSNDVNNSNRGIIVTTKYGKVDIPWDEFRDITFTNTPKFDLTTYSSYKNQKKLKGTVKLEYGESMSGEIVYDLDEANTYEFLQGMLDDIEFEIAFGMIKEIIPSGYKRAEVILKNGEKFMLEDSQDVSERNQGVLVFEGNDRPRYARWDNIQSITFD